jgi:peptidoglycan/LPS O-acetylase OafA/YrhL
VKRIDSLDTLRGLAILMVTAIHCSQAYTSTSGISNLLFPFGSLGVQLFLW